MSIHDYYARRAREYERIYDKPERQADLRALRADVPTLFLDETVLEIACGTGYWTPLVAASARAVVAVDASEETLDVARAKTYDRRNVRFERGDAYALPEFPERFSGCFAGFFWSHVPVERLDTFIASLHRKLEPGARVAFLDNLYVEGSSTPVARHDAMGNTFQVRALTDGTQHEVLKNFPRGEEVAARLARAATDVELREYEYYWLVSYRAR